MSEIVSAIFFFSVTAYSYFSTKRVLSVHQILKGSAPHWLRTTDTSDFPLNAVLLCGSSGVRVLVTCGRFLELLCRHFTEPRLPLVHRAWCRPHSVREHVVAITAELI